MPLPDKETYTAGDYWNLPDGQRAELISGKLYAMAPPGRIHQEFVMELSATVRNHIKEKNGSCRVYPAPFAVNLTGNDRTWTEPDISVICDPAKLSDRGCEGAPDWIIEIVSPSTRKRDYGVKLFLYRTAGVREYWIVNPANRSVNVYDFENEETTDLYGFEDPIPCSVLSGLTIRMADLAD